MSEWIANQLRELRALRQDVQTVIDALDPPKPKRKYTRRVKSPEQRELDVALRARARRASAGIEKGPLSRALPDESHNGPKAG